ncbi:hypothetical protein PG999_010270 [Apiospora kogelbergensis]|uniref:Uncharacterized protein n=2 Tax=Apiospora kogelbergensis TaxID=1337665 RepID=A0AAW0QDX4_9PEZI
MSLSRMATRQTTWPTTTNAYTWRAYQFLDWLNTLVPGLEGLLYTHVISNIMRSGMVLDFVHGVEEPFAGTVPWTHLFHTEPAKS